MAVSSLAKFVLALALLLPLGTTVATAQDMSGMDMSHPKKTVVNGADRPDLIPEEQAYRLVFAAVAKHPNILQVANLPGTDTSTAVRIIVNYQKAFQTLLDGQPKVYDPAAQKQFITQANLLIKITKQHLADKLTADGYEGLIAYVEGQKQFMQTTTLVEGGAN